MIPLPLRRAVPLLASALAMFPTAPDSLGAQDLMVRVHGSPGWNRMADWHDGIDVLRQRARQQGMEVKERFDIGIGLSGGIGVLHALDQRLAVGGEVELLRDDVGMRIPDPSTDGTFRTPYEARARSRVIRAVARFRPLALPYFVEPSIGWGWGHLDLHAGRASARGNGGGPHFGLAVGTQSAGRGLGLAFAVGVRWNPLHLDYTDVDYVDTRAECEGTPMDPAPNCEESSLVTDQGDLEALVRDRSADFSGFYLRLDLTWSG